jgi:hypothetical protein
MQAMHRQLKGLVVTWHVSGGPTKDELAQYIDGSTLAILRKW